MRASTPGPGLPGAAFLALAILITPAGNATQAQELLVMPYACSMAGGRPMLTPATEQSHAIVGQREQRTFTACSPANPAMCRTWTVHRFDLDCGGARVPWVSVVGSAAEQAGGRAWAEDGRLRVRMGWQWGMEADDPCARGPGFDDRFGFGRMRRYCADRRAMMPPPIVEMPYGFAPMLGIDGIFVRASAPSTSQAPATLPPIATAPAPPWAARTEPQPPRDVAANDIPARAPPPAASSPVLVPPQATEAPPRSQPAPQAAAPPVPQSTAPPAPQPAAPPSAPQAKEPPPKAPPAQQAAVPPPAPKPASPSAATAPAGPQGGPIVPRIINRPDAADASATATTTLPKVEPAAEPSQKSGVTVAPKEARQDPPADVKAEAEREGGSVTVSLLSAARSPVTGAIAVFAGLTFGLLTAFVVARRRERMRFAHAGSRDLDAVWTRARGGSPKPALRLGFARGQVPPNAAASAMHRVPTPGQVAPGGPGMPAAWSGGIPKSRAEAMQVLGMGVAPDASDTALKKIVDGLRLTWHPDLAKDEADRQLRELRIKQINAAWDIIQGRRGEV